MFGFNIIVISTLLILLFKEIIFNLIVRDKINNIQNTTIILFGLYFCIRVWSDTFSTLLLSINKVNIFYLYVPIQAGISFLLQYNLGLKIGINGIVLALIISFLLTAFWILPKNCINILMASLKTQ